MIVTIPRYKSFQYREVFKIISYYSTGEAQHLKSIGFIHIDSINEWKNKPDIEIAPISTTKNKEITFNLI